MINTGTIRTSGLNTNKERAAFWRKLSDQLGDNGLKNALLSIDPNSAKVLRWYYTEEKTFDHITILLNRSMSTVRNYHNRGMFELQQYYMKQEKHLL